tara:strand:+ start:94 stop:327 length:234 start_codon:yes stop_codon:yes gene_type:complete
MKYSKKIIQILSEVLIIPVKNLSSETNSENEPKWDSIAHVRVILEIEKKFKIKIDTNTLEELRSVRNINKYLENKAI